jgi:hypothetical protein
MRYLVIIVVCLVLVMAAGCSITGNPDDQFEAAWQNSENDVKAYGNQMRTAMGPEGSSNYDIKAMSEGSNTMIGIIDHNYDTISMIQVSCQYIEAQQTYLSSLSDLRVACVDLSKAQDAGGLGALEQITVAAPFLESSQQKRDRVTAMMG